EAIRGMPEYREAHFESSRAVLILQRLPEGENQAWAEALLRADLERFEEREKIDLGLHLGNSLKQLDREETFFDTFSESAA
ncbi:MAG: hypothetical protein ACXVB9_17870, partial [Bdellovibrionota bacterium]